ncbi:MAG: carboxypeptidase-like regulatory domain-containing protein [Gemmatimonadetes bacterium]|nr:carboxypeptidase-like regulatory domain-containing protein [Gemmatimonadota bacterium]
MNHDSVGNTDCSTCSVRIGKPWPGLSAVCAALLLSIAASAPAQDRTTSGGVAAPGSLLASAAGARAAGSISGTVVEAATQSPVFGALVGFGIAGAHVSTDANGRVTVADLPGEVVAIQVRALGYRPVIDTVQVGDRNIRIRLTQVAVSLDAIVVTGTAGATEMRAVGNAVSKITVADVLQSAPVIDVHYRRFVSQPYHGEDFYDFSALLYAASLTPTHRRLGELYEARGEREKALEHFGKFVELWKNADPELQPVVRDVRARIARLTAER